LVAATLILVPALAAVFGTAAIPAAWVPPMALATLLVLGADTLHKRHKGSRRGRRYGQISA
ncbi:MAG: hypothetical protein ACKOZW_00695, partial [Cyanobium sp.]